MEKSGDRDTKWEDFVSSLPKDQTRFAVFDFPYTTEEKPPRSIEKLIFIYWSPDDATSKDKMVSATTKEGFKKRLVGLAKDIQAKDISDVNYLYMSF